MFSGDEKLDSIAFQEACERVINKNRERSGIGTLSEKTLHAVLKRYFEPDTARHEVKIGNYIADIAGENGITEIQTRSFDRLRAKLTAFLEQTETTVVFPIAAVKYLRWIDSATGEISDRRKSPRPGNYYDAFPELYKIKPMLCNPRLHLCLVLLEITEYRNLDGWSDNKKRGSSRYERIPEALIDELHLDCPDDYARLVPGSLPPLFTAREFALSARIPKRTAQTALNILSFVGVVVHVGKRGREFEYRRGDMVENCL